MANLAPTQVEQLQRIGADLRQVRQEQGLSLDILANQIFIRPSLLQALETGRADQLPEPVFIQGFIRRYAESLGLDGRAISQEFTVMPPPVMSGADFVKPAVTNGTAAPVAQSAPSPAAAPTAPAPVATPPSPVKTPVTKAPPPAVRSAPLTNSLSPMVPVPERGGGGVFRWLLLVAAILAIVGGLGIFLGRGQSPQTTTAPVGETPTPEPTPTPVVEPEPEPEPEPVALEAPIVLAINLTDRAWLSVVADGRMVYEGTPDSGYEETWTAQSSLVFTTGNAGAVSVSFNGEDPVVLGNAGAVRTLRLNPNTNPAELTSP